MQPSRIIVLLGLSISSTAVAGIQTNGIQVNGIQTNGIQTNGIQTNGIQTNGIQVNGIQVNGIQVNGIQTNGIQTNGIQVNGIQVNGIQVNGIQVNGIQVNGSQLFGSFIGLGSVSQSNTCSHREDAQGAALNSCSPCATLVGNADSYCRTNYWDQICVNQAIASCKAAITSGSTLQANFSNGQVATMAIASRSQQGWTYNGSTWVDNSDVWWNTVHWQIPHAPNVVGVAMGSTTPSACVRRVVAADPYCGSTQWDSICVNEASSMCTSTVEAPQQTSTNGDSVCGYDSGSNPLQAIFVGGLWDTRQGVQGAGGKLTKWPAGQFTLACRSVGAVAKCVDFGYKPWVSTQSDKLHQSCVRAVRDDLCGDGTSHTANNTTINITDFLGIQPDTEVWNLDAAFTPNGATYVTFGARVGGSSSISTFENYKASHPYCATQTTEVYASNWSAAWTLDGNPNQVRVERRVCGYQGGTCP